jgi:putative transposase
LRENDPDWNPRLTRKRGRRIETHFWQSGGGYDRNIESRDALLTMIDYIHLNPVRKGFVGKPEEWKWSSARQYLEIPKSLLLVDAIPAHCLG